MLGFKLTTFEQCPPYWKNYVKHQTKKYKLTWGDDWLTDSVLVKNVAIQEYNATVSYEKEVVVFPDEETFIQFKLSWS